MPIPVPLIPLEGKRLIAGQYLSVLRASGGRSAPPPPANPTHEHQGSLIINSATIEVPKSRQYCKSTATFAATESSLLICRLTLLKATAAGTQIAFSQWYCDTNSAAARRFAGGPELDAAVLWHPQVALASNKQASTGRADIYIKASKKPTECRSQIRPSLLQLAK